MNVRRIVKMAVVCAAVFGAAGVAPAMAQDRGLEVGGQLTTLRLGEFDTTDVGVGVQAAYKLTPRLAVDGLLSWFPGGDDDNEGTFDRVDSQTRVLGLAGIRYGVQQGRIELFARARPGFLHFSEEEENVPCILIFPTPLECQVLAGHTAFATDFGGGVRVGVDAANTMHVSFDISDLLVRYGMEALRPNGEETDGFVSHNLMVGVGFGWKF